MTHDLKRFALAVSLCALAGCGDPPAITPPAMDGDITPQPDAGPMCTASGSSEASCDDDRDDDCDGFTDCLDTECEGQSCGDGFTCTAGACLRPGSGLPELPPIANVRATIRRDTAVVEFEPVDGARDYRIYPLPNPDDVLLDESGALGGVRNAIYRCAGDRPIGRREHDHGAHFDFALGAEAHFLHGFARTEADSILGYVYLTPAPDRQPVYRVADPNKHGAYHNADWLAPLYNEAVYGDYVVGAEARDAAVARGWHDQGIAFYVPTSGTRPVFRLEYATESWGMMQTFFFTEGPEHDARADDGAEIGSLEERFRILAAPAEGAVALHRVTYGGYWMYDVLAAGEARFERALHQGRMPIWSLTWPGLTERTTLVIEALDQGCPFPGGYISAAHMDAANGIPRDAPSITVDEARLASGEVFVNGQHDPANRPIPVARAYVEVEPSTTPEMDFFEGFDASSAWEPLTEYEDNNSRLFRNDRWVVDTTGCTENFTFGPVLGQLVMGFGDWGSSCGVSATPRNVTTELSADRFLHVRMSTDIPSTGRRYPQILITTAPILELEDRPVLYEVPLHVRLGRLDAESEPSPDQSIVVQPFGGFHQLNVQFCDQRGWGVNSQCPQANIYGHHAGDYVAEWEEPWLPNPVLGERAGYDRPVQIDVYSSTERVYVFLDGEPAGCAVLPAGRMPAGDVTVAFRAVGYHLDIDESVTPENTGHLYERTYSQTFTHRRMDDFGIDNATPPPAWDETRMPCGDRWYGGSF
jgi:hypothetical protein